jgi:tetratricopeptide (TPR) repeat protein
MFAMTPSARRFRLAQKKRQIGQLTEARQIFDELVSQAPHNPAYRLHRAMVLADLEIWPEARADIIEVRQQEPNNPAGLLFEGIILTDQGEAEQARDLFTKLSASQPENLLVQAYLGLNELRAGNIEVGVPFLQRSIRYANPGFLAKLALFLETALFQQQLPLQLEDFDVEYPAKPAAGQPKDPLTTFSFKLTSAFIQLRYSLAPTKKAAFLHLERGIAFYDQQRYEAALRECQQARAILPDHDDVNLALAEIYFRLGDYDTSLTYFRQLHELEGLKDEELNPEILLRKGAISYGRRDYDDALRLFRLALENMPTEFLPIYLAGMTEIARGEARSAQNYFGQALACINFHILEFRLEKFKSLAPKV